MKIQHHLFSLSEIRLRLREILGEPGTAEEKQALLAKAKRIYTAMPVFTLKQRRHTALHTRLRRQERITIQLQKRKDNLLLFKTIMHMFAQNPPKKNKGS